jgi:hypothetical protein
MRQPAIILGEEGPMKRLATLCAVIAMAIPGTVMAALDGLEDIGPDGSVVTVRVIDGVTVSISTQGGFPMLACSYNDSTPHAFNGAGDQPNVPLNPGNVSGTRFISSNVAGVNSGFPYAEPIIFELDQPVVFFGLTTVDLCENNDTEADISLKAYNAFDVLIDEHNRNNTQGGWGNSGVDLDWHVSGEGIVKVELAGTTSEWYPGYGIDDLELIVNASLDDLEDIGSDNTVITTRVIDGVTVTISTGGGYPMRACTYNDDTFYAFAGAGGATNVPLNPGNVSGTRFISSNVADGNSSFPYVKPIIFEFDRPVTFFGLTTLDLCETGDTTAWPRVRAYDASDNLVDNHVRYGPQGDSGLDLNWSVSGAGMMKVELTGDISPDYGGYGIDDLMLAAPPEVVPTFTWAGVGLMCVALAVVAMALMCRRRVLGSAKTRAMGVRQV